ncbi:mRNA turnover protein 4 like protein [Tupaia chinensis]|uniref:mRNA turnover protein 4 like protein n=1 Tax=Tupaia chinensis TaxID=246437 RepID=L9JEK4_TUPCH|nr:mRNA turnover protein 4 like protein [Tupaia chinensis]
MPKSKRDKNVSLTKTTKKGLERKQNLIEELRESVDMSAVVTLLSHYEVCREGDVLTPEQARILKLSGYQMAEFKVAMKYMWNDSLEGPSRWAMTCQRVHQSQQKTQRMMATTDGDSGLKAFRHVPGLEWTTRSPLWRGSCLLCHR